MAGQDAKLEHARCAAKLPVVMEILGDQPQVIPGTVVDLSRSVMRVCCAAQLSAGTLVALSTAETLFLGEIIWCVDNQMSIQLEQSLSLAHLEQLIQSENHAV